MDGPGNIIGVARDVNDGQRRDTAPAHASHAPNAGVIYTLEALASAGTNLLIAAIYFYMAHRYGWGLLQNFLLACGQGVVYIVGALSASGISERFGKRLTLAIAYGIMALLAVLALLAPTATLVTVLLLAYTCCSVVTWPILEGLISTGLDSRRMSRQISRYNLVWAGVGVVMLAVDGAIIQHWPAGVFLIPAIVHAISMVAVIIAPTLDSQPNESQMPSEAADRSIQIEPELLHSRTLALWLSRVALPATYVVIFGLMSLMPSLPVMRRLDPTAQTALGCIWMLGRWLMFLLLGLTAWWHTRPRLLLIAAIVMFVAFLGVTIRPSDLLGHGSQAVNLLSMAFWQLWLGVALGLIYAGSLYFGMVLSEGSTEHGGYHEALIGLGMVLGPGSGALAQWLATRGSTVDEVTRAATPHASNAGIAAVGAVIALSVLAVIATTIVGTRRSRS